MKISLFQVILIAVFGIGAVIGLVVFATYKPSTNSSTDVGTVVIWGTLPEEGIRSMLASLSPVEPRLKGAQYAQKSPDTLAADVASAIATGSSPDIILASQEELLSLEKFISPIPYSAVSIKTFVSTFAESGNIFVASNGAGYYGLPFLIDPLVLYANRSILSTAGIPKPPATWEGLLGLVPRIAVLTSNRQITRGLIGLGTYTNVHNARAILSTLFLQTGIKVSAYSAGGYLTADLGLRSTGFGVPPGQAVLGFYTQFADPNKVSYTWNASLRDSQQMFLSGDLAFYLGYASEASFLRAANPNLNFVVTEVPQPANADSKKVYGLTYALMISRAPRNPAGANIIASLLTSSNMQLAASASTGLAPATLGPLGVTPPDPVLGVAYGEALYTDGWLSPAGASVDAVFSSMIGNVNSQRTTIETALSSAEQLLTARLQQ